MWVSVIYAILCPHGERFVLIIGVFLLVVTNNSIIFQVPPHWQISQCIPRFCICALNRLLASSYPFYFFFYLPKLLTYFCII